MKRFLISLVLLVLIPAYAVAQEEGLEVTVYTIDLGLIKDIRYVDVPKGFGEIEFRNVASRIDPTSVHFKSLGDSPTVLLEQNYEFDLASTSKIMEKYRGSAIELVTETGQIYEGILMGYDGGSVVLMENETSGPVKSIRMEQVLYSHFPELPEGLISRPTLVWHTHSDRGGRELAEVSYLTSGLTWHAEYVAVAAQDDRSIDLAAWVSIDNRSGATYEDAEIKLVAGDVHKVVERPVRAYAKGIAEMEMAAPPAEEAFAEYHLYTMPRRATIKDNQIKQLTFFPSTGVAASKEYEFDWRKGSKVRVTLKFANSENAGLGVPLPGGKVRVYKRDNSGSLQFAGEDIIDHTAVDETVNVYIGDAFDVVAERKKTDYRKISTRVTEEDFEVVIRNHKDEDVVVKVVDHFYAEWDVISATNSYRKRDASTLVFDIGVAKDGTAKIAYTVRTTR
jgi:hypothetical protein